MTLKKTLLWAMAACAMTAAMGLQSCKAPQNITYFQDVANGAVHSVNTGNVIRVRPDDRLSIVVMSKDPELASMFNLPIIAQRVGQPGITTMSSGIGTRNSNEVGSYVVNAQGDINFPVLGEIHIGGMTRQEVADYIQNELKSRNLLKDPTVIVDFLNHSVRVLGDVNKPGKITFDKDKFTVLDALSEAGDLAITGERENVLVMREEQGKQVAYRIDLTNAQEMMSSPAYYMQQDDVIYVSPNDVRKRNSTATGNQWLTPSIYISIGTLLTSIAVLCFK